MKKASVFIKVPEGRTDLIKEHTKKFKVKIDEAFWLSFRDKDHSFYELKTTQNSLKILYELCTHLIKHPPVFIEQINVYFKNRDNCLEKLQDKGFSKYEEVDYVDFDYKQKNVKVVVAKEDNHFVIKLIVLDSNKETDITYYFRLIRRVLEIVR